MIKLEGDLDARAAQEFLTEVGRAAEFEVEQLFLDLTAVSYLSSAGLRGLVVARQKMADEVRLILVGANEAIQRTIRLVGFQYSLEFADVIPQ